MNNQLVESLAEIINKLSPAEQKFLATKTKLLTNNLESSFYETATTEEWINHFKEWADKHSKDSPVLSDYAVSRESIYNEENWIDNRKPN